MVSIDQTVTLFTRIQYVILLFVKQFHHKVLEITPNVVLLKTENSYFSVTELKQLFFGIV